MDTTELSFAKEDGWIYARDEAGKLLCEVKYSFPGDGTANIHRTFVDDSLRGQGIAGKLVTMAVEDIETRGLMPDATCSYADVWLQKHRPEIETTARKSGPSCSL